jgi:capsular polysaccharide biosynthesis protein
MEGNNVELFDYLRVIWKRKILIIVMTLVSIVVVVVGVMYSRTKLPVTYKAVAVVKIGQKVY